MVVSLAVAKEASFDDLLAQGTAYRLQGSLELSIQTLLAARLAADSPARQALAAGELGASLLQARRLEQAEEPLREAHAAAEGRDKARHAIALGKLAAVRKRSEEAGRYYREAMQIAGDDSVIRVGAALNLVRLAPAADHLQQLTLLLPQIDQVADPATRAGYHVNLAAQARQLGRPATALAYRSLDRARVLLRGLPGSRLQVETLDLLAQLYEDNDRADDARKLTRQAIADARRLEPGTVADLLIGLEWRLGRLERKAGRTEPAIVAYQRAVDQIEAIRQDIPIEYDDGRSSYRQTLEPIYLGLAELLLERADRQPEPGRGALLRRARETIELTRQAELQDFLGDRCTVEVVQGASRAPLAPHTAVLYPVLGSERVELLLETARGIVHRRLDVKPAVLREAARRLAKDLRNGNEGYQTDARKLYDWLLRPFENVVGEQEIRNLVVVPDGALRLVAFGALHDGQRFAIEKYAVSSVTGLSMTNISRPAGSGFVSLVSGVAEPGSVVDKLNLASVDQILGAGGGESARGRGLASTRKLRSARNLEVAAADQAKRIEALRQSLALPGVKDEIQAVGEILKGNTLLDAAFTVDRFRDEARSGAYGIVHVASHGIFGGSADSSYILAHDDLLTMDGLQSLLKSEQFKRNPIELLTLSACETAEGDERSPLGISGAALKARARSVLGTLWPVEDGAARRLMESFYTGLARQGLSKTEALRQAQVAMIREPERAHPFFWAPFTLIGNWL